MIESTESLDARMLALESALASLRQEVGRTPRVRRRLAPMAGIAGGALVGALTTLLLGAAYGGLPAARQEPQVLTVRAPFNVVDNAGAPVLTVEAVGSDRNLQVRTASGSLAILGRKGDFVGLGVRDIGGAQIGYLGEDRRFGDVGRGVFVTNAAQKPVAGLLASNDQAGMVAVQTQNGSEQLMLRIDDDRSGLFYYVGGKIRAQLGRRERGNTALLIRNGSDADVAGMGEAADGSGGAMVLRNAAGAPTVTAGIAGNDGQVVVRGSGGGEAGIATSGSAGAVYAGPMEHPRAKLFESLKHPGAGTLVLTGDDGTSAAVEAGFDGQSGVVHAYGQGKPMAVLKPGIKLPGTP